MDGRQGKAQTGERPVGGYLLRHRDFCLLWTGQSVSRVGDQVSQVVLPLLAVQTLNATTFQIGALTAISTGAILLVGLPAGAWIDRVRRRPVMVVADLARLVALGSIPMAYLLDALTLYHLYVTAFVAGILTVFFDVAARSYLPSLVGVEHLVEGNAKLSGSAQVSLVIGPSLAGGLVGAVGAVYAVLADAASYLVSAATLGAIRRAEIQPARPMHERLHKQIGEGLSFVFSHPVLRTIAVATAWSNFFGAIVLALGIVFLVRVLDAPPGIVGVVLAVGSVGGILGAFTASIISNRIGTIRSLILGLGLTSGLLFVPLSSSGLGVLWFAGGSFCYTFGTVLYNINQVSLRQRLTPPGLLGRMNATMQFTAWGVLPFGALVGGAIGDLLGIRVTILIGGLGSLLALVWLLASPIRKPKDALFSSTDPSALVED